MCKIVSEAQDIPTQCYYNNSLKYVGIWKHSKAFFKRYLSLNISEFACLFSSLREEVGSHFQHGCSVVVDSTLLQLSHLCFHTLFDVVLNLQKKNKEKEATDLHPKKKTVAYWHWWLLTDIQNIPSTVYVRIHSYKWKKIPTSSPSRFLKFI